MLCQGFFKKAKIRRMGSELRMAEFLLLSKFTDQFQLSKTQSFCLIFIFPPITSAPSSYLWNLCLTPASTILEYFMKKAGPKRALYCRWHKIEATQTAGQR